MLAMLIILILFKLFQDHTRGLITETAGEKYMFDPMELELRQRLENYFFILSREDAQWSKCEEERIRRFKEPLPIMTNRQFKALK